MPPAGLAHAQTPPGATTCLLVGRTGTTPPDLRAFRAVLWLADEGAESAPPRVAPGARVQLVRPADPAAVATLDGFVRLDPRHLPAVLVTPDGAARGDLFSAPLGTLAAQLEAHHRARLTRQQDGFRWQRHLLQNLPAYARRRVPAAWRDALRGLPAVICGAGPSLDVSAARLAGHTDGVVVFAADSALRTLARHGVTADFVVTVDVAKDPARCLPDGPPPARALMAAVSPPAWNTALPTPPLYLANNQVTTDWLATLGLPPPALAVTENCGVTALELARFLGCAPLHLLGLDLALTPGDTARRHTAGADAALYTQSGFNAAQAFPEVPGNHTPTVPTHVLGDLRALDTRLAGWPAGLVVNVNDRGARLRNTTVVHPADFTPPAAGAKPAALAALPAAESADPAAAFARLRAAGDTGHAALPGLRAALASGGPAALAAGLRPLLGDPVIGRALGGFSLKAMPHLLPPTEGDAAFWGGLLDEFAELTELARTVR